jgi:hypothetical protein
MILTLVLRTSVLAAVRGLPPRQGAVIALRYLAGLATCAGVRWSRVGFPSLSTFSQACHWQIHWQP